MGGGAGYASGRASRAAAAAIRTSARARTRTPPRDIASPLDGALVTEDEAMVKAVQWMSFS